MGRAPERGDLREPRSRPAHARAVAARLQPRPPHSAHSGLPPAAARLLAAGARPGLADGPAERPLAPSPSPAINPKGSPHERGTSGERVTGSRPSPILMSADERDQALSALRRGRPACAHRWGNRLNLAVQPAFPGWPVAPRGWMSNPPRLASVHLNLKLSRLSWSTVRQPISFMSRSISARRFPRALSTPA